VPVPHYPRVFGRPQFFQFIQGCRRWECLLRLWPKYVAAAGRRMGWPRRPYSLNCRSTRTDRNDIHIVELRASTWRISGARRRHSGGAGGKLVYPGQRRAFEREFARLPAAAGHAVGVGSGTERCIWPCLQVGLWGPR